MLGTYKPYDEVPMGVKAVVEAIHEPPQEGDLDGLSLDLPWEEEQKVVELANAAGLQVVGMIFTDLTPDPKDKTKTLCKRHGDSFFLSSLETTFAARQQLDHPLKTKSSPTGSFSSRLVTAVLCGTPDGGIDLACYMVSEQGCAMVDADMIEATVDPNTVRIKLESEGEGRYVPRRVLHLQERVRDSSEGNSQAWIPGGIPPCQRESHPYITSFFPFPKCFVFQ